MAVTSIRKSNVTVKFERTISLTASFTCRNKTHSRGSILRWRIYRDCNPTLFLRIREIASRLRGIKFFFFFFCISWMKRTGIISRRASLFTSRKWNSSIKMQTPAIIQAVRYRRSDSQKAPVACKSRGPSQNNIVALSRKFILETAVGLFRVLWPHAALFFRRHCNDREKTQRFQIVDLSLRTK